jgi:hypothetical protein
MAAQRGDRPSIGVTQEQAAVRIEVGGSRLYDLQRLGQSVWLDCSHPRTLAGSQLARLIKDGISGVDCNPVGFATKNLEALS